MEIRIMLMKKLLLCLILAFGCGLLFGNWGGWASAREPFFHPTPPLEAYDFPRAAEEIKLRGLLLTEHDFRAVVYLPALRVYQVLRPLDRLEVMVDGLRHEFQVEGMGRRFLVLRGQDNLRYEIGVEEHE
jgi:hypothetical protein